MINVLLRLLPISIVVLTASAAAQTAAFCPDGWACGKPEGHSAEMRKTRDGGDICLMPHILTTDDGTWRMMMTIYSVDIAQDVHLGFGLALMKRTSSGAEYQRVPLRSFRVLSADRKLDTRAWKLRGVEGGRPAVQIPVDASVEPVVVAAIGIATGEAYGVLAETTEGKRIRIEARATARVPAAIRYFQTCVENRDMPAAR